MKNLLLVKAADICYGGVSVLFYQLLELMDREQLHVDLYTYGGVEAQELYRQYCDLGVNVILGGHPKYHAREVAADLNRLMRDTKYDIVHCNTGQLEMTAITMSVAFLHRVPLRIAHSHTTNLSGVQRYGKRARLYQNTIALLSNCRLGCSEAALEHLFGQRGARKASVLKNGIDSAKYVYDPALRRAVRERLHIPPDAVVVGHVGRFAPQKNHDFLLDVFAEVLRREPRAHLLLVGDGNLLPACREKAGRLGVDSQVTFAGASDRAWEYYQAMDAFLFPSICEGLGIVAVEAQACGLPVVCADTVPPEAQVTAAFEQLSLQESPAHWSEVILSAAKSNSVRSDRSPEIRAAGYDISDSAAQLSRIYLGANQ